MKVLVVYESMWGNTERVARAVASGLTEAPGVQVEIQEVSRSDVPGEDVDLVVAGGPTHAFSMTRPSTRADAVTKGAPAGSRGTGLREWIDALPAGRHAAPLATFDTRVDKVRHLPGSAARSAAKAVRRHGYAVPAPPQSFYVRDMAGPLLDGELDRATAWGRQLVASHRS